MLLNKWAKLDLIQLNSIGPQLMLEIIIPPWKFKWRDLTLNRETIMTPSWSVDKVGGLPHARVRQPARGVAWRWRGSNGREFNPTQCGAIDTLVTDDEIEFNSMRARQLLRKRTRSYSYMLPPALYNATTVTELHLDSLSLSHFYFSGDSLAISRFMCCFCLPWYCSLARTRDWDE